MRPYLAIIKDSFREALASRVLWILLLLITLLLAALAPMGMRSEQTTEFRAGDFRDARAFAQAVVADFEAGGPSPGYRIMSNLESDERQAVTDFAQATEDSRSSFFMDMQKINEALNDLLAKDDLYREEDWQGVLLGTEVRELLDRPRDSLSENELARMNRLLIELPYEEHFRPQPSKQIVITYVGADVSPAIRTSERRVKQVIELGVVPALLEMLLGPIGILTAVLVTASIIPQMFDPGALSLLLSKPLSRSLMFLTKFVGGCAFILINAAYFFTGLWLLLGLRLDIWNHGFLLCIPLFLFLFAVYYSVSALTGVVWRNAVVCVVLTILFWAVCLTAGLTNELFDTFLVQMQKITGLVPAGETLIAVDERGATRRWNAERDEWEQVFLTEGAFGDTQRRVLGPVYDAEDKTLLAAYHGHRMFRSGGSLLLGEASDGWKEVEGPALPDSTFELLPDPRGRLLAVTYTGIYALSGDLKTKEKVKVFFMEIPQSISKPFRRLGPDDALNLSAPAAAAVDLQTANVVIYSRGELLLLARQGGGYGLIKQVTVDDDAEQAAVVAITKSTILLGLEDGRMLSYRVPDLQFLAEYRPEPYSQPRFLSASPDGQWFAIVFHNGRLHLLRVGDPLSTKMPAMKLADVRGQGSISAAQFTDENTILIVDRVKRVTEYRLGSFDRIDTLAPDLTTMEMVYYYGIMPIYTVFPKPSDLDNTIQYLLQQEETLSIGPESDLRTMRAKIRPWAPVRSSLIFMIVVLVFACVYIERQDF